MDPTGNLDSSIGAGGRYDNLIDEYLQAANIKTNRTHPGVGISFGLDRMVDVMKELKDIPERTTPTQVLLVPMQTTQLCMRLANILRKSGVATAVDMSGKKLGKIFAAADTAGIPFVGVVGEDEAERNMIMLKNLKTGEQEQQTIQQVITTVK